jgi:hypothetical protein
MYKGSNNGKPRLSVLTTAEAGLLVCPDLYPNIYDLYIRE